MLKNCRSKFLLYFHLEDQRSTKNIPILIFVKWNNSLRFVKLNVIEDQYLRWNFKYSQGFCLLRGSKIILDKNDLNKSFLFFQDEKNELSQKAIGPLIRKLFFWGGTQRRPFCFCLYQKTQPSWRVSTSGYWF